MGGEEYYAVSAEHSRKDLRRKVDTLRTKVSNTAQLFLILKNYLASNFARNHLLFLRRTLAHCIGLKMSKLEEYFK